MFIRDNFEILKRTFLEFFKERSLMHGAALAYYALFALVPILYLTISYVGRIIGHGRVTEILKLAISQHTGIKDMDGIFDFLDELDLTNNSFILELVGVVALLFSASALMMSMRRSLNIFMDIQPTQKSAKKLMLSSLISRGVSLLFVATLTIVVLATYFAETILLSMSDTFLDNMDIVHWIFSGFSKHGIPLLMNLFVFLLIFKFLHSGKVKWKYVLTGSIVTTILLYTGQILIKLYLGNYFFAAESGIAGALMIILLWVYYSSQIIFFGAKYIKIRADFFNEPITID